MSHPFRQSRREALGRLFASASLLSATTLLASCGGGGSNDAGAATADPPSEPGPPAPPTVLSAGAYVSSSSNVATTNGINALHLGTSNGVPVLAGKVPVAGVTSFCLAPGNKFLYAANGDDSTIAIFNVDPATGALTPAQTPSIPNGAMPGPMAIHPSGNFLCVGNPGSEDVRIYQIDPATGVPSRVDTIPLARGGAPIGMAMHPSGQFLLVGSDGGNDVTGISIFSDGTGRIESAETGFEGVPAPLFIDPSGRFVLFSYAGTGIGFCFPIDGDSGRLITTGLQSFTTPAATEFVRYAFHPTLVGCVYATTGGDQVGQLALDGSTGAVTSVRWFTVAGANLSSLAVDAGGGWMYACDTTAGQVHAFSCDPANGNLTHVGSLAVDSPRDIVLATA